MTASPVQATHAKAEPRKALTAAEPCAIVIFGASGDLTRRKLMPALYELAKNKCLAKRFSIIGFARSTMSDDAFRQSVADSVRKYNESGKPDDNELRCFADAFTYLAGDYNNTGSFQQLENRLQASDRQQNLHGNRLYYLATPPSIYPTVIEQIGKARLSSNGGSWVRIIIEKPFGRDLQSARELNRVVLSVFDEQQVYRIDHFLGKNTVQNLLALRFGNGIFEPLWNRNYIDHVQITAAESLGIEQRAAFYETTGALRDMVQSHLLQVTSFAAMEPPAVFDATALRNEKIKVLQSVRPYTHERIVTDVIPGQYAEGSIDGKSFPGYRQEPNVNPNSDTETFVAARVLIDNWRWAGVPFYIRTGKRLPRRVTEVAIQFRSAPHLVFRGENVESNSLILNIQPEEGISLRFNAKLPGQEMHLAPVNMDFSYRTAFGDSDRSAYATLLNDCMRGDATLFDRADGVEASWALLDPIVETWRERKRSTPLYRSGTWGPPEADELLERDGRHWRKP